MGRLSLLVLLCGCGSGVARLQVEVYTAEPLESLLLEVSLDGVAKPDRAVPVVDGPPLAATLDLLVSSEVKEARLAVVGVTLGGATLRDMKMVSAPLDNKVVALGLGDTLTIEP